MADGAGAPTFTPGSPLWKMKDVLLKIESQDTLSTATYNVIGGCIGKMIMNLEEFKRMWKTILLKRVLQIYKREKYIPSEHKINFSPYSLPLPAPLYDLLICLGEYHSECSGEVFHLVPPVKEEKPATWWEPDVDIIGRWRQTMHMAESYYIFREYPSPDDYKDKPLIITSIMNGKDERCLRAKYNANISDLNRVVRLVNDDLFEFKLTGMHAEACGIHLDVICWESIRSSYICSFIIEYEDYEDYLNRKEKPVKSPEQNATDLLTEYRGLSQQHPIWHITNIPLKIDNQDMLATATYDFMNLGFVSMDISLEDFKIMWKAILLRRTIQVYESEKCISYEPKINFDPYLYLVPAPLYDLLVCLGEYRSECSGEIFHIVPPVKEGNPAWWEPDVNIIDRWRQTMNRFHGRYVLRKYPSAKDYKNKPLAITSIMDSDDIRFLRAKYNANISDLNRVVRLANDDLFELKLCGMQSEMYKIHLETTPYPQVFASGYVGTFFLGDSGRQRAVKNSEQNATDFLSRSRE